ncbi:unnamed protein product [Rotaria magnacalcarata]|uniref:ADP ribosyltransferase domain-containing protein n=1 Tax=Rotaria magnacalcarata TaxID=392030 RepID=A0A816W2B8_9BILA|nr:unnamed protein product [Rotaria magnacalcarata]
MANSGPPDRSLVVAANNQNVEIFSLVWLDQHVESQYIRNTESKLRPNINLIKKFADVKKCQQYVEDLSSSDRVVMIVSGVLGQQIVPSIHKLEQVISIYVYCMNKERNKRWSKYFTKVKGVINEVDELVSQIRADRQIQRNLDEPFSHNLFNVNCGNGTSTSGINGKFIFSQVLIDCILRIKSKEEDKKELITCCKQYYVGNCMEMNHLDEFEKNYSPDKVLWWYSRESFFYNVLNRALRNENIHIIFLFREFICDIYHQLKKYQVKTPITTYRCQLMSSDELKTLNASVGNFISVNSFFSSSASAKEARSFIHTFFIRDNLEPALFEITADPNVATNKPFADISIFSEFNGEYEVVFMLGSIFRLNSVRRSSDHKLWVIQRTLCSEDTHVFPTIPGNARWVQHGVTVSGEFQNDSMTYQLCLPYSLCIDDDSQTMIIADYGNDRIFQLKTDSRNGEILAGGGGVGTQLDQLNQPTDVIIDKKTNSLIMCDRQNRRCLQWSLSKGTVQGEILFDNICCWGLAIDDQNNLYVSDTEKQAVLRCTLNDKNCTIVAGGRCRGAAVSQPEGLFVDTSGTIYVVDSWNHRVIRWPKKAKQGTVIAGGNGQGNRSDQLNSPVGLSFDQHGNL